MKFELIKKFGEYKKGRVFDSFDGLVRGIATNSKKSKTVNFDDKTYFKIKNL